MATLFITIGPQCCGKTSFLQAHGIVDINMDSVPGTYESLSLEVLFKYSSDDPRQFSLEENQIYEQKLHGLTIAERIEQLAQSECYALILFFHERITRDQLYFKIKYECQFSEEDTAFILEVASELFAENYRMESPTVELFIIERRFESVRAAQAALSSASEQEDQDIAWGNTNLFPKSYHFALEVAHRTHRRVKFIKWGYELEGMDVTELYRRDILRFLKTGRFVPLSILLRYYNTANELYGHWQNLVDATGVPSFSSACDALLLQEAGYDLSSDGFLIKRSS